MWTVTNIFPFNSFCPSSSLSLSPPPPLSLQLQTLPDLHSSYISKVGRKSNFALVGIDYTYIHTYIHPYVHVYTKKFDWNPNSTTMEPDRWHDRPADCVIAQQYSPARYAPLRIHFRKKNPARVSNMRLLQTVLHTLFFFLNSLSMKLSNLKPRSVGECLWPRQNVLQPGAEAFPTRCTKNTAVFQPRKHSHPMTLTTLHWYNRCIFIKSRAA